MKIIILVPDLNSLCQNLLCTRSLPQDPVGSWPEGSSWTPSSCPESPCPPATHQTQAHPLPAVQVSWSCSLNRRSSSFYPLLQPKGLVLLGTDPGHSEKHCLPWEISSQHCSWLGKKHGPRAQRKERAVRRSQGNGAGKWELPMFPNSFKLSCAGLTAGAAQQGSGQGGLSLSLWEQTQIRPTQNLLNICIGPSQTQDSTKQ